MSKRDLSNDGLSEARSILVNFWLPCTYELERKEVFVQDMQLVLLPNFNDHGLS